MDTTGLPGVAPIEQGLRGLALGHESEAAPHDPSPEHRSYARLALTHADSAHSRYNALIRTLVSFERAGACVN